MTTTVTRHIVEKQVQGQIVNLRTLARRLRCTPNSAMTKIQAAAREDNWSLYQDSAEDGHTNFFILPNTLTAEVVFWVPGNVDWRNLFFSLEPRETRFPENITPVAAQYCAKVYQLLTAEATLERHPYLAPSAGVIMGLEEYSRIAQTYIAENGPLPSGFELLEFEYEEEPLSDFENTLLEATRTAMSSGAGQPLLEATQSALTGITVTAEPPQQESGTGSWNSVVGKCRICNKTLTLPKSVIRGIGPLCWSRLVLFSGISLENLQNPEVTSEAQLETLIAEVPETPNSRSFESMEELRQVVAEPIFIVPLLERLHAAGISTNRFVKAMGGDRGIFPLLNTAYTTYRLRRRRYFDDTYFTGEALEVRIQELRGL